MRKVDPPAGWPLERDSCIAGNPYSPVAVAVEGDLPAPAEVAVQAGAAFAMRMASSFHILHLIANVVSNPNVRYLLLAAAGPQSPLAEAFRALTAPAHSDAASSEALARSVPPDVLARLTAQVTFLQMPPDASPAAVGEIVSACCGNHPRQVDVGGAVLALSDPGALDAAPLVWRPEGGPLGCPVS